MRNTFYVPEQPLEPPEPNLRKVFTCEICGDPIYEGEDYYDIPDFGQCHDNCIHDCKRYEAE